MTPHCCGEALRLSWKLKTLVALLCEALAPPLEGADSLPTDPI